MKCAKVNKQVQITLKDPFISATEAQSKNKKRGYDIIEQLKKTRADISLWELIQDSPLHCEAILKILQGAFVSKEISSERLAEMIDLITTPQILTFSEEEVVYQDGVYLPPYITVACYDVRIPKVLVDNGSSLNVCPLKLLVNLRIEPSVIIPTSKTVRPSTMSHGKSLKR